MKDDPASEYVIGLLEPRGASATRLLHWGRQDIQVQEPEAGEEDETPQEPEKGGQAIEIDPLSLPKTVGISFSLEDSSERILSVCVTYSRYKNLGGLWKREPAKPWVDHSVKAPVGTQKWTVGKGVVLYYRGSTVEGGGLHVSFFLVNETAVKEDARPTTEDMVFQPQIRIVLGVGSKLKPLLGQQVAEEEEASLALLYRNHQAMARGHLCGAVWKEVDPERPLASRKLESPAVFEWADGELLDAKDRRIFSWPDLRTEYLPAYPIRQSEPAPKDPSFRLPELEAEKLSDSISAEAISSELRPIVEKYRNWIDSQETLISSLPSQFQGVARKHIDECRAAAVRIESGVGLLTKDDDARLAFCFMNKVMSVQYDWRWKKPLNWRVFQIAFILQCIPGLVDESHHDRSICDLLWYPTGGGKTEAYLGLAIFLLAYRRRKAISGGSLHGGLGTAVLSRYTLRLLTIQQFRRALNAITAAELLRVDDWKPKGYTGKPHLWGEGRFSLGLWVGGQVTPNRLVDYPWWDPIQRREKIRFGAVGILAKSDAPVRDEGEPAQILNCPACDCLLAVSQSNLTAGEHTLRWIVRATSLSKPSPTQISDADITTSELRTEPLPNPGYYAISVRFKCKRNLAPKDVDRWWFRVSSALGSNVKLSSTRASRPGYFIRKWGMSKEAIDFEIRCPNQSCPLNKPAWWESISLAQKTVVNTPILEPFVLPKDKSNAHGIPIPAYVVDDQIYARTPSMIVATVDKFARLAFEPRASSIFGIVDRFDTVWGYFRDEVPPERGKMDSGEIIKVEPFLPPDLIIQDELHLIEGPLGSMVGIYENAIELLSSRYIAERRVGPKYVASTATIRHAGSQVLALFSRTVAQFPPKGLSIDDSFFSHTMEVHPEETASAGRLYVGVCAPGYGPQTVMRNIWAILLQVMWELGATNRSDPEVDNFWTTVGYFNAIRELATAAALYREDIPLRIENVAKHRGKPPRPRSLNVIELSSRTPSEDIPGHLSRLSTTPCEIDAVFATSMFGTGVDIDRLGLMVVGGQPKTTANYIQATGRVGRKNAGLVITYLRAARPRDLDHYEFFVGYHQSVGRLVEPITVYPFSPRACERALGPVSVAILRNASRVGSVPVGAAWAPDERQKRGGRLFSSSGANLMKNRRYSAEVQALISWIEQRSLTQPDTIKPAKGTVAGVVGSELDSWHSEANKPDPLVYNEWTLGKTPEYKVVLGDPQHEELGLQVFENAPQSLRDVEATTTFEG